MRPPAASLQEIWKERNIEVKTKQRFSYVILWPTLDPLHAQISVVNQMSAAINGTAVMDNRVKVTDARATSVTNSLSHQSSHPCFNTRRRGHADFQKDKATMNRKRISNL